MANEFPDIPRNMRKVQRRFEQWRSAHTGRLPIPQHLWMAPTELAREHGVFDTAKALHLEYGKLKRLLGETSSAPKRRVKKALVSRVRRAGLPMARWESHPPERKRPSLPLDLEVTPLDAPLRSIRPLEFRQVRRTPAEALFNCLIEQYHPLAYTQPVGEHLKYIVYTMGRPIACLAWSSAPRHLGSRDRFIDWSAEARRRNIRFLAYNPRFLILPWVRVKHLASHVLGQIAQRIATDWERIYGHPIYFLETFVDPTRYRGTCYRAANWVVMGRTTGRGKNCPNKRPNRSIKEVLGYPLTPRFRQLLAEVE